MRDSADNGDLDALYYLGTFYWNGIGVEVDYEKAVEIFHEVVEQAEDKDALFYLGYAYGNGTGALKNDERSFAYYKRSALAGELTSKNNLADDYYLGRGTKKDMEQALFWYRSSAEDGNDDACCTLGRLYQEGIGVKKDEVLSANYYEKACKSNTENQGLECYLRMAYCYYKGIGVKQNEKQAEEVLMDGFSKTKSCEKLTKDILVRRNNNVAEGTIGILVEQLITYCRNDEITKKLKNLKKYFS